MKIKSIHVNNFGKLHNVDLSFDSKVNSICEENGWGKSTLSAFIRAMLYGLEGDNRRDEITCERKRYAPWQGGAFGGSIIFEADGKEYIATRIFHDKAVDDEFELRDKRTNLISEDYSFKLGEELFNINSESFMKTVFIRQNDAKSAGTTGDINAKLGNISDGIDLNKFSDADTLLKDVLNQMSPSRKTGELNRLKARVSEIKSELLATNEVESSLNAIDERIALNGEKLEECNGKLRKLNETRSRVSKLGRKRAEKDKYEELIAEVNKKFDALSILKSEVGDKLPDRSLIDEWKAAYEAYEKNKAIIDANSFSETESSIYHNLVTKFSNRLPDENDISTLIEDSAKLQTLKQNANRMLLTYDEKQRFERLSVFYNPEEDYVEVINEINSKWSLRNKLLSDYESTMYDLDELRNNPPNTTRTKVGFASMLIASIAVLLLSIIGGFFVNKFIFVAALLSIALGAFGVSFKKQEKKLRIQHADNVGGLDQMARELDREVIKLDNEIADFLQAHGRVYREESVLRTLSDLIIEASDYKSLYRKNLEASQDNSASLADTYTRKISNYLESFNINVMDESFQSALVDLRAEARHYVSLKAKSDSKTSAINECERIISDLKASMREYGIEPGLDISAKLSDLYTKLDNIELAKRIHEDALKRKEAFEKDIDVVALLTEENDEDNISLEELDEQTSAIEALREELRGSIETDNRQKDNLLEQYEARQELLDELDSTEERIKAGTKEYKRLTLTQEFLTRAKESLTARYMEPLLSGFHKYYKVLTDSEASDYRIDANTKVTIEAEGKQRDTQLLSSGYQDLTGLCMRLAMADAMYPDEKPMLILDDPFVNLDDRKLDGGKKLLDVVSKDYQVLYFTCSKSRL